jgi:hypothetical protein
MINEGKRGFYESQIDHEAKHFEKFMDFGEHFMRTPTPSKSKISFREMLYDSYEDYLRKIKQVK